MFESQAIADIIFYKWNKYAWYIHYIGAFAHVFYLVTLSLYIYQVYLIGKLGEL